MGDLKHLREKKVPLRSRKASTSVTREMMEKQFLLARIVETADDAIITKTSKGIITFWNAGAAKIYGYLADEVLGKPISLLIPPGHADEFPERDPASGFRDLSATGAAARPLPR